MIYSCEQRLNYRQENDEFDDASHAIITAAKC